MKKEEIIVSFETAKKLKEAGRNKECVFKWEYSDFAIIIPPTIIEKSEFVITEIYQAPTSEEIIEELHKVGNHIGDHIFSIEVYDGLFYVDYYDEVTYLRSGFYDERDKSLSEASAKMWLWLKENKHL